MQRVTVTLDEDLLDDLDRLVASRGYQSRSEALRDLARAGLQQAKVEAGQGHCVAALVYTYDHSARELAQRLTRNYHDHREISLATLHVHLDDDTCLEVTALKGSTGEVKHFAEHVIAERGVRYGKVLVIPAGARRASGAKPHSHR